MGKKTDGDIKLRRERFIENATRHCQRMQKKYNNAHVADHSSTGDETASVASDGSSSSKSTLSSSHSFYAKKQPWDSKTRHVDRGPYVPMHTNRIPTRVNEQKNKPEPRDDLQRGWKI